MIDLSRRKSAISKAIGRIIPKFRRSKPVYAALCLARRRSVLRRDRAAGQAQPSKLREKRHNWTRTNGVFLTSTERCRSRNGMPKMNLHIAQTTCPALRAETALKGFLGGHVEALICAAGLLGSEPAVRRTARLIEAILSAPSLTRRMRQDLIGLHRLLSLDCVDDRASLEAACFAKIDPASPVVEEICELSDSLYGHLIALADTDSQDPLWNDLTAAA